MKKIIGIVGSLVIATTLFAQKVYDNDIIFKNGSPMNLKSTIGIESDVGSTKINEKENNIEITMQDASVVQITPAGTAINPAVITPTVVAETGNIDTVNAQVVVTSNFTAQAITTTDITAETGNIDNINSETITAETGNIETVNSKNITVAETVTTSNVIAKTLEVDYKLLNNFYVKYLYSENHVGGVPYDYLHEHEDELGNPLWEFSFRGAPYQFWNFATNGSTAVGLRTSATGYFSHAEGTGVWRKRDRIIDYSLDNVQYISDAERLAEIESIIGDSPKTQATALGSHAEGACTIAAGPWCHSEGGATITSNFHNHAEGTLTWAIGEACHAEGAEWVYSTGYGSHAEGTHTLASGTAAHAEGAGTKATAFGSHADGRSSVASNNYSYVWSGTYSPYGSHGVGTYSINPMKGIKGYYIGEETLDKIIEDHVAVALSRLEPEEILNPEGNIDAEFNKIYVFENHNNDTNALNVVFRTLKKRPNLVIVKGYDDVNFYFMENRNKRRKLAIKESLGSRDDDDGTQVFEVFRAADKSFVFKR